MSKAIGNAELIAAGRSLAESFGHDLANVKVVAETVTARRKLDLMHSICLHLHTGAFTIRTAAQTRRGSLRNSTTGEPKIRQKIWRGADFAEESLPVRAPGKRPMYSKLTGNNPNSFSKYTVQALVHSHFEALLMHKIP